jgi:hypothetical protein
MRSVPKQFARCLTLIILDSILNYQVIKRLALFSLAFNCLEGEYEFKLCRIIIGKFDCYFTYIIYELHVRLSMGEADTY